MDIINKERSPFYPGQPVPVDFFIGRIDQINRIRRAMRQVELGKPESIFLTGEYGIGKSSLAGFMRYLAERDNNILGIYVLLGDATELDDLVTRTLESAIQGQTYKPSNSEKIRNFLSKYIGKQELFGVTLNFEALKADAPNISRGFLPFLRGLYERLKGDEAKGLILILDEINGISKNPKFAHFIKAIIDENALSSTPVPLLLMLCGVKERMREMIQHHQPVERIFDIVEIMPMNEKEMEDFFGKSFRSVETDVTREAMNIFCHYSAGFPKIMHIIGDASFWIDKDKQIDNEDAMKGVIFAADEVGKKFFDQQVLQALRSKDYRASLAKHAEAKFDLAFKKEEIQSGLSEIQKKNFNNLFP